MYKGLYHSGEHASQEHADCIDDDNSSAVKQTVPWSSRIVTSQWLKSPAPPDVGETSIEVFWNLHYRCIWTFQTNGD